MSAAKRPVEAGSEASEPKRAKGEAAPAPAKGAKKDTFIFSVEHLPGNFEPERHFYDRVLNAQLHPMVASFLQLSVERLALRYCHLNPGVDRDALTRFLKYEPKHFRWGGSDLFCTTNTDARRAMLVVETNSCPSGQKSMPYPDDVGGESAGYKVLLQNTFLPLVARDFHDDVKDGVLAVVYDKNEMEASGYAAELATLSGETVYRAEFHSPEKQPDPPVRWSDDGQIMSLRMKDGSWRVVRACFRYVTQQPWARFPLVSKTKILNPIVACLSGGRNKLVAAKAYELFNAELAVHGLEIRTPTTMKDVSLVEVPLIVKTFGGRACIKVPYSNAGQGVWTITSKAELDAFMAEKDAMRYDKFIVQSLVGNSKWSSVTRHGQAFHIGTVPNKKLESFVCDIRMMVGAQTGVGYRPVAVYARRAAKPLADELKPGDDSWAMLGTNLSVKESSGDWSTETNRLLLMDRRDFNRLGLGLDDLIDGYVQTTLSCIAIDQMCVKLMRKSGFNIELFSSLNEDEALLAELYRPPAVVAAEAAAAAAAAASSAPAPSPSG